MNYKQILAVVVGVAFVLSMVALYDPNYSNDDVTGAFSFREMFGRSKTVEKTMKVVENQKKSNEFKQFCDYILPNGEEYSLSLGSSLNFNGHNITFKKTYKDLTKVHIKIGGTTYDYNLNNILSHNGLNVCLEEVSPDGNTLLLYLEKGTAFGGDLVIEGDVKDLYAAGSSNLKLYDDAKVIYMFLNNHKNSKIIVGDSISKTLVLYGEGDQTLLFSFDVKQGKVKQIPLSDLGSKKFAFLFEIDNGEIVKPVFGSFNGDTGSYVLKILNPKTKESITFWGTV